MKQRSRGDDHDRRVHPLHDRPEPRRRVRRRLPTRGGATRCLSSLPALGGLSPCRRAREADLRIEWDSAEGHLQGFRQSEDFKPFVEITRPFLQALVAAAGSSAFAYGFSSGAVLLLHAALAGSALQRLALLEPPLPLKEEPDGSDLGSEVAELVAAGRRGDAVEHFNKSIGVPEEMLVGMRDAPFWPTLEQAAHTLVYDTQITSSLPLDRVSAITTPALVRTSQGSDERLPTWGRWLRDTLPNASLRTLAGA